jgi:hypothetical protein
LSDLQSSISIATRGLQTTNEIRLFDKNKISFRDTNEWNEMESCFNSLYQSETLKIAIEQAIFPAVYHFIQKEKSDQHDLRLAKYQRYFNDFLDLAPGIEQTIRRLKAKIS